MRSRRWDERYLRLARHVSSWSKDPSTRVGAVAIGDHGQPLSFSYNGFPRGVVDDESRLDDRQTKYRMTVHAELNCVYNASLSGTSLRGSTLYVWGLPTCCECAKGIVQSGVARVVMCVPLRAGLDRSTWWDSFAISATMFAEARVEYEVFYHDDETDVVFPEVDLRRDAPVVEAGHAR